MSAEAKQSIDSTTTAINRTPIVHDDTVSFIEIATALLRHIRLVVLIPFVLVLLTIVLTLAFGKAYIASSAITLTTSTPGTTRISSLAAQLGVSTGAARPAESLDFYAALLQSREVLRDVILSDYVIPVTPESEDSIRGNLIEVSGFKTKEGVDPLPGAISALRKQISVQVDLMSSILTIDAIAFSPELAEQINRYLLDIVNRINIDRRMSQAAIERSFIAQRLEMVQERLAVAEASLEEFLLQNRAYSSPTLAFEQARLQHKVDLERQLYISLIQAHEAARIDEVRDTPLISIVDPPEGSARRHSRLKLYLLISIVLGGFSSISFALLLDKSQRARQNDPETFKHIDELRKSALRRILSPRKYRQLSI